MRGRKLRYDPPKRSRGPSGWPTVLLVARHTSTYFDYTRQRSAVESVVSADRSRQLLEQFTSSVRPWAFPTRQLRKQFASASAHRPVAIEFPVKALVAVSRPFYEAFQNGTDVSRAEFDTSNVLPGFVMCVLDWYARAFRNRDW